MRLPRSKLFWSISLAGGVGGGAIAYDRYKLGEIRREFSSQMEALGMEPANDVTRKVTLVAVGRDSHELYKIRQNWRTYAVDLFTKAGCDYQLLEVNLSTLDKEVDKLVPIPDGQVPPSPDRPIPKIVSADNWIRPTMLYWIHRLNRPNDPCPSLELWKSDPDQTRKSLLTLWEERRPEPKSLKFFEDGIVALDKDSKDSLESGVLDFVKYSKATVTPKLGYIPCDPSPSWSNTIYNKIQSRREHWPCRHGNTPRKDQSKK